jgi:hypothetical protein
MKKLYKSALAIIGIIFLISSIVFAFAFHPSPYSYNEFELGKLKVWEKPTGGCSSCTQEPPQGYHLLSINVKAPNKMQLDNSDNIIISAKYINSILKWNNSEYIENEMKMDAKASVSGSAFTISANNPFEQVIIGQKEVTWIWSITPNKPGAQIINYSLQFDGYHLESAGIYNGEINIQVENKIFSPGEVNLANLITGILGAGISVPWLYEKYKEFKEKKRIENEQKPKILRL